MARETARHQRRMANTSDAPTRTATSSPTIYPTDGYGFNYTGLVSYPFDELNYTELWLDVWNSSTEPSNVTERINGTVLIGTAGYCDEWEAAQHKLFQAANLFFAAAFLVPRSFKASVLALRTFLTAGFMLAALWAGITICALDAMLWCLALGLLNGIHSLILACRFLPPALSPELAELYLKLFKPYKVSKKHFQELAKEARILKLDPGQTYATEGVTPADERLSILLRGKLNVTCDGTHLHYVRAYQFIDSPEWEAMHENIDDVFQVTIRAEESSVYICWTRLRLLRVLRHRPLLKVVLNTLVGKDITAKLYALNEQLAGIAADRENTASNPYRGVARSVSVDAVNTETAGRVRSTNWQTQRRYSNPRTDGDSPSRYSHQYWAPVVANHFPATSPFTHGQKVLGYTLLSQTSVPVPVPVPVTVPVTVPVPVPVPAAAAAAAAAATAASAVPAAAVGAVGAVGGAAADSAPESDGAPASTARQRSCGAGDYTLLPQTPRLERKRSKKGPREVTFETPV